MHLDAQCRGCQSIYMDTAIQQFSSIMIAGVVIKVQHLLQQLRLAQPRLLHECAARPPARQLLQVLHGLLDRVQPVPPEASVDTIWSVACTISRTAGGLLAPPHVLPENGQGQDSGRFAHAAHHICLFNDRYAPMLDTRSCTCHRLHHVDQSENGIRSDVPHSGRNAALDGADLRIHL